MLKKLRAKFILTNTLYVGVVLIIVFITLGGYIYTSTRADMQDSLAAFLTSSQAQREAPEDLGGERGAPYPYLPISAYTVTRAGEITPIARRAANIEGEALRHALTEAINAEGDFGAIGDRELFYLKRVSPGGVDIALTDASYLFARVKDMMLLMALIYMIAMCVVTGISFLVAKIALNSTENTWEQQKRFIADASHALKTPLTVILANISILKGAGGLKSAENAQWLSSTEEEANDMKKLIDEMLILAQSDLNVRRDRFSDVGFSKLVQGLMLQFEALAFDKRVNLDAQIQPGVYLRGNDKALAQMASALIENAIKYEDEGGQVRVKLEKQVRRTVLSVYNASSYIPPEDQASIFGRFYRSKTPVSVKREGYGLGLAIARSVAEAHAASIDVESTPTGGTEFRVTFKHIL